MAFSGAVIFLCFVVASVAGRQPDWHCNFDDGSSCDIQETIFRDGGFWEVQAKYFSADFYPLGRTAEFTLPFDFEETTGILSFGHYSKNGWIDLRSCEGGAYSRPTIAPSDTDTWNNVTLSIACPSKIEVSFRAGRNFGDTPDIGLDNIAFFRSTVFTTDSSYDTTTEALTATSTYGTITEALTAISSTSSVQTTGDSQQPFTDSSPGSTLSSSISPTVTFSSTAISDTATLVTKNVSSTTVTRTTQTSETNPVTFVQPQNSTSPKQKGNPEAVIISVSVVLVILFILTITVIMILHQRRVSKKNAGCPEKGHDDNVYTNATFSPEDYVELNHPDVIKDTCVSNGLPSSLTNPQDTSFHHLPQGVCKDYRDLEKRAQGQGDYTDLKHKREDYQVDVADPKYLVLEQPSEEDSHVQHKSGVSSTDDEDQAYDHLDRGVRNANIQDELREGDYGAAAVMSAEDEYNVLVHGNEAGMKPQNIRGSPKSKGTALCSEQDAGNEYQTLGLVNDADPLRSDDTAENEYNVLGETDKAAMGCSGSTSKDATSGDDYHVLHSGKELGDYHLYQHPEEELSHDSPAVNSSKKEDEDYTYYYPVVDGQGSGVAKDTSRQEGDDYYSVVNAQERTSASGVPEGTHHEPIYSSDVYGELM